MEFSEEPRRAAIRPDRSQLLKSIVLTCATMSLIEQSYLEAPLFPHPTWANDPSYPELTSLQTEWLA